MPVPAMDRPGKRKPLHLAAATRVRVRAAGEALLVEREPAGTRLFPVARIDRVVCNRNTDWSGEALALCLARGVTLTWVDGRCRAVGDATPRGATPLPLDTLIENYLELADWRRRYSHWLRRRRWSVVNGWVKEQRAAGRAPHPDSVEFIKRAYVYNADPRACFDDEGEGWCRAMTVRRLAGAGVRPRYWGYDAQVLELAEDLGELLWAEFSLGCGSLAAAESQGPAKLLFFEHWAVRGQNRVLEHLADFKRHAAREYAEWQ